MTDIARRRGHKAYATKLMNEAEEFLKHGDTSDKVQLLSYKETLAERSDIIQALDDKILLDTKEEEIEKEILSSSEYHMKVRTILVSLNEALGKLSTSNVDSMPSIQRNQESAKLPKISLKSFSGDVLCFQEFWESFNSAVHSNQTLDTISKFNYLRGLLEGQDPRPVQFQDCRCHQIIMQKLLIY